MEEMTPLQRVVTTIQGGTPDRVPIILYFQSAAQHAAIRDDYTWNELLNNPVKQYRNIVQQYEYYGADNMFLPLDFRVEGEAFGSKCDYLLKCGNGMRMPVVTQFAIQGKNEIDGLEVPDPKTAGRCPVILKTIEKLSAKYGNKVPIVGFVNSPPDVATDVIKGHYSTVLPMMAIDKPAMHRLLSKISEFEIEFGKAMVAAGAHALATVGGGFNHLTIGPEQYREFVAKYQGQIVKGVGVPYCFHQCQDATPFFDDIVGTGAGAVAFHELVDLKWAKQKYGKKVILAGNLGVSESTSVGYGGTAEEVERETKRIMDIGKPGGMFWFSAGCEVHHALPERNIFAMIRAAKKYGAY
ncbi:MAG: uroporphyrinogen decarboxylase family protein [Methanomassiliicoccales archaeon]|nr:uroporphyrinogen decarboxylase family protein [Methanomassiliicoccales archaeon]